MKRILFSLLGALVFADPTQAIEPGDAERDVRIAWGNPVAARKKPDGAQVWRFKDGTTVWLAADGLVETIAGPASGNLLRRAGSTDWVPFPVATTNPPVAARIGMKSRPPADDMRPAKYFVLMGGLALVASILWSWAVPIRTGGTWLLSEVLLPLVSWVSAVATGGRSRRKRAWRTT